jgi:hypothetical protein
MMGISALTVLFFGLSVHYQSQNIFAITFLTIMNGFVASSRLVMKAHTSKELIIGQHSTNAIIVLVYNIKNNPNIKCLHIYLSSIDFCCFKNRI